MGGQELRDRSAFYQGTDAVLKQEAEDRAARLLRDNEEAKRLMEKAGLDGPGLIVMLKQHYSLWRHHHGKGIDNTIIYSPTPSNSARSGSLSVGGRHDAAPEAGLIMDGKRRRLGHAPGWTPELRKRRR